MKTRRKTRYLAVLDSEEYTMDGKKKDMEIGEIVVRELACILPLLDP